MFGYYWISVVQKNDVGLPTLLRKKKYDKNNNERFVPFWKRIWCVLYSAYHKKGWTFLQKLRVSATPNQLPKYEGTGSEWNEQKVKMWSVFLKKESHFILEKGGKEFLLMSRIFFHPSTSVPLSFMVFPLVVFFCFFISFVIHPTCFLLYSAWKRKAQKLVESADVRDLINAEYFECTECIQNMGPIQSMGYWVVSRTF